MDKIKIQKREKQAGKTETNTVEMFDPNQCAEWLTGAKSNPRWSEDGTNKGCSSFQISTGK